MVKFDVYLAQPQLAALKAEAKRTGLTVAEIIRRAVDAHLEKRKKE